MGTPARDPENLTPELIQRATDDQSYMGHAHYSTTQRYLHHKPRPQDAQRLHEAFRSPGADAPARLDQPLDRGNRLE